MTSANEYPLPSALHGTAPSSSELKHTQDQPVEFAEQEHLPPVRYGVASMSKAERAGVFDGPANQDDTYPSARNLTYHEQIVPDVYVVADGVGVVDGGEVASQTVAYTFPMAIQMVRESQRRHDGIKVDPEKMIRDSLYATDKALGDQKSRGVCPPDAGTTFVGAVRLDADTWGVAAAGDSPAYIVRADGSIEKVTEEQSDPASPNIIYNSLDGRPQRREPASPDGKHGDQVVFVKLMPGDKLLLLSDGVVGDWPHQRIDPKIIADTVMQYSGSPQGAADALLRLPHELQKSGYRYPNYGKTFMAPDTPFEAKKDDASAIVIERPEAKPMTDDASRIQERLNASTDEQLLAALQNEQFRGTEVDSLIQGLNDESVVDYITDQIQNELQKEPTSSTAAAAVIKSLRILHNEEQNPDTNTKEAQRIPHFLYDHLDRMTSDDGTLDEERLRSEKIALALALQYLFNGNEDEAQQRLQQITSVAKRQRGEEPEA